MAECPICRRTYDDRFKVFVPPYPEAFDTIECARSSARSGGAVKTPLAPVILPTIEVVRPAAATRTPTRRSSVVAFAPAHLALAGGVGLLAAGTAAAVYLAAQPPSKLRHSTTIAAGAGAALPSGPSVAPSAQGTGSAEGSALRPASQHKKTIRPTRRTPAVVARVTPARNGTAQLASNVISSSPSLSGPSSESAASTPPEPVTATPSPEPVTHGSPPSTTRPPPRPKTPKPKPPTSTTPAAPIPAPSPAPEPTTEVAAPATDATAATAVTRTPASANQHDKTPSSEKPPPSGPPPSPPPSSPPPTSQPPPTSAPGEPGEDDNDSRPGNGWGDRNHDHTGPPGHEQGTSGSSGSGCHGNGRGHDD